MSVAAVAAVATSAYPTGLGRTLFNLEIRRTAASSAASKRRVAY